jgi:aminoglycoside 3-N-acetyltransferase
LTVSVNAAQVTVGLRSLGVQAGDTLFVHSSLRSFGRVEGGAATVVEGCLEAVGATGTVAMPIFRRFFWEGPEQVWDRDRSPSLMGAITEALRTWPGARRSAHAPHPIAAVGHHAADLGSRRNRTDFAFDSPFQRLVELDAWIVMLGVGWKVCTLIHLLEERVEVEYREWVQLSGTVVEDGVALRRVYPFLGRRVGVVNDFLPFGAHLERELVVESATVGGCGIKAVRARDLYDEGMRMVRRDPLLLVSAESRSVAADHLSSYGARAAASSQQPQDVVAAAHPLSGRLAQQLHVTRARPGPAIEVVDRWPTVDGLQLEELRITGGVNELIPAGLALPPSTDPAPAIICLHGTGGTWHRLMDGGEFAYRQRVDSPPGWARELARRGFVTLAPTQWAQPPRREPWDWEGSKLLQPYGHTAMGRLVSDVVVAIDYLRQRPEVDAERIAVAGFSLGGIVSFYSFVVDERLAAAVSFCGGVGSVDEVVRSGTPRFHSVYYYIPGLIETGVDHPDLVPALAPRPLLICGASDDEGMPEAGWRRFESAAQQAYSTAGAADAFEIYHEGGIHALSPSAFEHAAGWLQRQLQTSSESTP